jgi:FAD/FMN-containing dehydrogenase
MYASQFLAVYKRTLIRFLDVNYVDSTLTPVQWKSQYYGAHYPRLSDIKRAVDPRNVFRFPQSIGLWS